MKWCIANIIALLDVSAMLEEDPNHIRLPVATMHGAVHRRLIPFVRNIRVCAVVQKVLDKPDASPEPGGEVQNGSKPRLPCVHRLRLRFKMLDDLVVPALPDHLFK